MMLGCGTLAGDPAAVAAPPPELRIESRKIEAGAARGLRYDWLTRPEPRADAPLVVIGHGFMRSAARMRGLGEHLARLGYVVALPDFRHSRPWAGGHAKNAVDLAGLAGQLGEGRKVAYAGYSAGGCAAMLAALEKAPDALVLLDPVFTSGVTADKARELKTPALALFARPGSCNAHGSGLPAAKALPKVRLVELPAASHAHFEFPLDPLALRVCGGAAEGADNAAIQRQILDEITRFLRAKIPPPQN
jgi:dienelactone hydrolase